MQTKKGHPHALIFDMDGTLFRTETLSRPAYQAAFQQLRDEGTLTGEIPPVENFLRCLGLLLSEIWEIVLPESSNEVRNRANELLMQHQNDMLKQGIGEMYPGVATTLQELQRRGYKLFVASNGEESYVKNIIVQQGLTHLFTALYSAGEFQTKSKVDLVRLLLDTYGLEEAWMCGDRSSDVEAGKKNGLMVVGCDYGGFQDADELQQADIVIGSFPELLDHLQ